MNEHKNIQHTQKNSHKTPLVFFLGLLVGISLFGLFSQRRAFHQVRIGGIQRDMSRLSSSFREIVGGIKEDIPAGNYSRMDDVLRVLNDTYYDTGKLQTGTMITSAVKAFVDAIDDPYTIYMDAEQHSGFQEELKGESDFEGIGAVIAKKEYFVLVEEVLKDSPAFKAGIMPLDRIIGINTGSVKDLTVNEAVSKIRGPKGTQVRLILERISKSGSKQVIEKTVTRDKLSVPSVTSKVLTGKNNTQIGLITISIIGEETEHLLEKTISELSSQKLNGIILDLRGNGGGLLPISVEIASHFIPEGELVVSADYKSLGKDSFSSKGYGEFETTPITVLVDGMTASAGEIIALALREQRGAKIIGTQSFGKGSIQTMEEFTDGASLKYTVGKRYTPSGKNIDKTGITPDVVLDFDMTGYREHALDNQLEKAKSLLAK